MQESEFFEIVGEDYAYAPGEEGLPPTIISSFTSACYQTGYWLCSELAANLSSGWIFTSWAEAIHESEVE